jgi:uncharacterized OB-fold protein
MIKLPKRLWFAGKRYMAIGHKCNYCGRIYNNAEDAENCFDGHYYGEVVE